MKLSTIKSAIGRSLYRHKLRLDKLMQSPLLLSDIEFVKRKYQDVFGYPLDLANPQTFNEKIHWRKLFDQRPIFRQFSDKLAVREYVAERIGSEYLFGLLQVADKPEQINFEKLPQAFIIKASHGSGMYRSIPDKVQLDRQEIYAVCKKWLRSNHYVIAREWGYKHLKARLIVEPLLMADDGHEIGYKMFCFHGKVHAIRVAHSRTLFTPAWAVMPYKIDRKLKDADSNRQPEQLQEMIAVAEKLTEGFDFLRIDLFNHNGKVYFNEITVYPFAGYTKFAPHDFDSVLGDLWTLPDMDEPKWPRWKKIAAALDYLLLPVSRLR